MYSRRACVNAVTACAAWIVLAAATPQLYATTIAWWRFEPGNFLADSSGNGNTLTTLTGTPVVEVGDVGGAPGSRGSAYFDGSSILKTLGNLNLSPYQEIQVSWWMKVQDTATMEPVEHSSSFNNNAGGLVVNVNNTLQSGIAGLRGSTPAFNYNVDSYPNAVPDAQHPDGVWEKVAVVYNLASADAANVVRVYKNGVLLPDQPYPGLQSTTLAPFRNDVLYVGGRGLGPAYQFKGNIDDLKIEALPTSTGPIAYWRFEPGAETVDSSGNGNTLTNFGAVSSSDVAAGAASGGSMSFDGSNDYMRTTGSLDLSPYRRVRLSYWMKVEGTAPGVVWEQPSTFINKPGGIVADVNDGGIGNGKAGVWTGTVGGGHYNLDNYYHAANSGAWQQVTVEFNRDGVAPDVTKVFVNGKIASRGTTANYADTVSFLNDVFYLGMRGGSSVPFKGKIDELKVEEFAPQPLKVFIVAGQSNAMGQYADKSGLPTALQNPQEDVILRANGTWTTLQPGRNTATANDFGPEITFGRALADAWPGQNIALVKYAVGATDLANNWNPDTPGAQYAGLIDAVNAAMAELSVGYDAQLTGMIWMQGESDALDLSKANAYEANLRNFIESVRGDLGVGELPFVIGQISDSTAWTYGDTVQQAQWDVGHSMPYVTTILTNDLSLYSSHYDAAGQMALGYRFAEGMFTLVPEPGSLTLLALGLGIGGLGLGRRRRRKGRSGGEG